MQASIGWSRPRGVLGTLLDSTAERVHDLKFRGSALGEAAAAAPPCLPFAAALRRGASVAVIAEVKRRSPSMGALAPGLDAGERAKQYAAWGAAAISVLTEPSRFGGAIEDLDAARVARVPLLRKDFVVDRLQLLEARAHGASAVLLIVRALPAERLAELHADAIALGLETLVEVHDAGELAIALGAGYPVVGVNNRNLETLAIDHAVGARLVPQIPSGVVAVYESGVETAGDVERAASAGADAVLVGSALSASADPGAAMRALTGVARRPRHAS